MKLRECMSSGSDAVLSLVIVSLPHVSSTVAGGAHTAAITSSGRAVCWAGDGDGEVSGIPDLNPDESFVMICTGGDRTAAITSSGRAAWRAGDGDGEVSGAPELNPDESSTMIFAGFGHTAAIT